MTPADQALRDAFLAELWPVCKEVSREDRDVKRKADRAEQRAHELREAESHLHTDYPKESTDCAQTCAQIGPGNLLSGAPDRASDVGKSSCRPNESTPERGGCNTNAPRGLAS